MQAVFSQFKQVLSKTLLSFGFITLVCLLSAFTLVQQPVRADAMRSYNLTPEEKIDRAYEYSKATGLNEEKRQEAYEQAVKDAESPESVEKAYERNLKSERAANTQPNLLEKAEKAVEKVIEK